MKARKRLDVGIQVNKALLTERQNLKAAQENLADLYMEIQERIARREQDFWQSVYRMTGFPDGDEGDVLRVENGIEFMVDHAVGAVFIKCGDPAVLDKFFPHLDNA